eukprot:g8454.t1
MTNILQYLDIRSLCNVKRSSLIQQCRKRFGCDDFERVRDEALSIDYEGRRSINEMILSHPARRLYLLIERYKSEDDMTLKDMVSQEGKESHGYEMTPLQIAAYEEHFQIVQYLIEQCEADPNIANSYGRNALHYAARDNERDTALIQFLLNHMAIDGINKTDNIDGHTPLDCCYEYNDSPIQEEIIALLRSKGGI